MKDYVIRAQVAVMTVVIENRDYSYLPVINNGLLIKTYIK